MYVVVLDDRACGSIAVAASATFRIAVIADSAIILRHMHTRRMPLTIKQLAQAGDAAGGNFCCAGNGFCSHAHVLLQHPHTKRVPQCGKSMGKGRILVIPIRMPRLLLSPD